MIVRRLLRALPGLLLTGAASLAAAAPAPSAEEGEARPSTSEDCFAEGDGHFEAGALRAASTAYVERAADPGCRADRAMLLFNGALVLEQEVGRAPSGDQCAVAAYYRQVVALAPAGEPMRLARQGALRASEHCRAVLGRAAEAPADGAPVASADSTTATPRAPPPTRWAPWLLTGLTAAALTTTGVSVWLWSDAEDRADAALAAQVREPEASDAWRDALGRRLSAESDRARWQGVSVSMGAVAASLLLTSLIVWSQDVTYQFEEEL